MDNHLPERTAALSAPQSGPPKQLAAPVDNRSGVQAFRIDFPETLPGQALRSADGRGALRLVVNIKILSRAPASNCHSRSPGIFKMFCLDLEAIWSGCAPPSVLQ